MIIRTRNKRRSTLSKLLSCLLVITLLAPIHIFPAHAADTALVFDDFSSYEPGRLTIGSGNSWTSQGTAPIVNVANNTVTGSTYAEISHDVAGSSYIGQRFAADTGGLIIEFDVNLPSNSGGTLWVMDGNVNATSSAVLRYTLDGGVIKRYNAAAANQISYDTTHWYRFQMVFNTPQQKFTVHVTDLTTETEVTWPDQFYSSRDKISSFGFYVNPNGGKINLANVKVTALDLALSKLSLSSGNFTPKLVPPFDPKINKYTVDVPYSVNELDVTPTASNPGGVTLKVGDTDLASGDSVQAPLASSSTDIRMTVNSSAHTDIYKTYTVTVNKLDKSPNVNYPATEPRDSKVLLGWEEPMDPAYKEAHIYMQQEDHSLELVDVVPKGKFISTVEGLTNDAAYTFVIKAAFEYEGEAVSEASGVTVTETPVLLAPRQMESLDRGLVAVKESDHVYVGWRMLGTDPSTVAFNLYRDGKKVNSAPITSSTNYEDAAGTSESTYYVSTVIGGAEQEQSETAAVWDMNYLNIPIQKPADGVTPAGDTYSYRANDASVGDLDGDGQYEIVLKWEPTNSKDNSQSGYTGNTYVDAYKMDGTFLWRIDLGVNIRSGAHYLDVMVYDLDGDGKAEVSFRTADGTIDGEGTVIGDADADYRNTGGYILTGPEYHTIFEGATGKALATDAYEPARGNVGDWGDTYGNRVDRFLATIAYLDGERPSIVMQRGYYTRMVLVAYDWRDGVLTKRWTFDSNTPGNESYAGQGNHQLTVADVDGDGKDEIITGAAAIDDDGTGLWNSQLGHGDAMHLGDLDPNRLGLELWAVQENTAAKYSAEVKDAKTGRVLWGQLQTGIDTGRGLAADIDPNYDGAEMWAIDGAWNSSTGSLFAANGELISNQIPSSNFAIWWDGDLSRELLDHQWLGDPLRVGIPKIDKWDYTNKELVNIETFTGTYSNNDTKGTPALQADLLGDWREEVIVRTEDSTALRIYTTTDMTDQRIYTLMHDPTYRLGIAWQNTGYNQPPHTGFYLGNGMEQPPMPNIRTTAIAPKLSVSSPASSVTVGQQLQLSALFTPASAAETVHWSVYNEDGSDTSLSTINASGLLSTFGAGTVKVVAAAESDPELTGYALITIQKAGGGSSGGAAPTPAPSTTVAQGKITAVVSTDTNGTATVDIKAADVRQAIESAGGSAVTIEASIESGTKQVQLSLPAQELSSAADEGIDTIALHIGLADVTINAGFIKSRVSSTSSTIELTVKKADTSALPSEVKAIIGNNEVYDFSLTIDGKKVESFGDSITVELPYVLKAGENANQVVIYYIDEQGKLHVVKNSSYNSATGKVSFKPEHFSQYAAIHVTVSFKDIAGVAWAKKSIESLAAKGIVAGVGNDSFKPNQKVTRAEFLKMLMYAFDLTSADAAANFRDVEQGSWYYESVASAQKLGIIEGKADGSFGVNDQITREDMAVMAYRLAKHQQLQLSGQAGSVPFTDKQAIAAYALEATGALQSAGIIQGLGEGRFGPKGQATRAEAAVIIDRLLGLNY